MSSTRLIARNTGVQFVGKIFSTLLGLLAVAIMTRSLGPEHFGWYVTATAFLQFVAILSDFGFTLVTASMLAQKLFPEDQLLSALVSWRFLTSFILHALAVAGIWLFPYSTEIKIAVAINAFSSLAGSMSQVFIGYYQTKLRMAVVSLAELLGRIILVMGVWLVATKGSFFLPMVIAATIPAVVNCAYLAVKSSGFRFNFNSAIGKAIFTRTWPTATTILFNSLYAQGDRVLLPLFVNQVQVGIYGAAYRVLDLVLQSSAMITGVIFPLLAATWIQNDQENFKKYYHMIVNGLALFLFPTLVGVYVLAHPIMRFLAGPEFALAGNLLAWLAFAIFGYCVGMAFGHVALAIDKQRQAIRIYAIDAALSLVGYLIFIPRFGIFGAAGVTVFSEIFAGIGLVVLVVRFSKHFPPLTTLVKIAAASFVMGYVIYRMQPLALGYSVALGIITYTLLAVGLRIIPVATIQDVMRREKIAEKTTV